MENAPNHEEEGVTHGDQPAMHDADKSLSDNWTFTWLLGIAGSLIASVLGGTVLSMWRAQSDHSNDIATLRTQQAADEAAVKAALNTHERNDDRTAAQVQAIDNQKNINTSAIANLDSKLTSLTSRFDQGRTDRIENDKSQQSQLNDVQRECEGTVAREEVLSERLDRLIKDVDGLRQKSSP